MQLRDLPRPVLLLLGVLSLGTALGLVVLWPGDDRGGELAPGLQGAIHRAEVESVREAPCEFDAGRACTVVEARLVEGPDRGRTVSFTNGVTLNDPDLAEGDAIRMARNPDTAVPAAQRYSFADFERRRPLLILFGAFVAVVLLFGRRRGLFSLVGLAASLAVVTTFLVPAVLDGKPTLAVALIGSLTVMLLTLALAHGVGPKSAAAALGTAASLLLTALLAVVFIRLTNLSGFSSEEAVLLSGAAGGVSTTGLVVAGMVIAALGVLDDVTVSQASAVFALRRANAALPFRRLYSEAIDIGRDHVAATVNTLVLAYVGASLPILLVFSVGDVSLADAVNREAVTEAIVGMLVGSIGLIAAVPLTTAVAAGLAVRMERLPPAGAHVH